MKPFFLILFSYALITTTTAQNKYDIKEPTPSSVQQKCGECLSVLNNLPPEVTYGFYLDGRKIYFMMTDKRYFELLFKKGLDGIAVDIITKSQFPCGAENSFPNSNISMGKLLKPIYYKDFKKNIIVGENGHVAFKVATLPEKYLTLEYELNLLVLKNNNACFYTNFFDLPQARWGLLEMGLYKDTIVHSATTNKANNNSRSETIKSLNKKMKFIIPFEKGKSEYSPKDIKPLYDSLRLTDYTITKTTIKAYSSVEGSLEGNIKLQNKRAESIVKALQSFQEGIISTDISASENWVEFLMDVSAAGYSNIAKMTKEKIKTELNTKGLSKKLEPILKNHRKAIIVLELEKKTRFQSENNTVIKAFYKKAIKNKTMEEAIELQKEIFARIRNNKMPAAILKEFEIPKEVDYGTLLKNNAAFEFEQNEEDIYAALVAFKDLEILLPKDNHIKYNICVLQLKSWVYGELLIEPVQLLKDIKSLTKRGINGKLVKYLTINYHIINSEYMMFKQDYAAKDVSLNYIYKNYKYLKLSNQDYLQLARYFASYGRYDWSEKVLKPHIRKIDVDEELLFYYLNLTIIDQKNTKNQTYRTIMLNAINLNKKRFCSLFDPYGKGGINFQLLNDAYLKSTYCENCNK
jgi:outer membrane protein OmpA-like peptidoglycan-associated protein